jgi:hypothetical protein
MRRQNMLLRLPFLQMWKERDVERAIEDVLYGQGDDLATWGDEE